MVHHCKHPLRTASKSKSAHYFWEMTESVDMFLGLYQYRQSSPGTEGLPRSCKDHQHGPVSYEDDGQCQ